LSGNGGRQRTMEGPKAMHQRGRSQSPLQVGLIQMGFTPDRARRRAGSSPLLRSPKSASRWRPFGPGGSLQGHGFGWP